MEPSPCGTSCAGSPSSWLPSCWSWLGSSGCSAGTCPFRSS